MCGDVGNAGGKKLGKLALGEPCLLVGYEQRDVAFAVFGVVDDDVIHDFGFSGCPTAIFQRGRNGKGSLKRLPRAPTACLQAVHWQIVD